MKTLTIIALLCSSICYGQCKYTANGTDPFTKKKKIVLKKKTVGYISNGSDPYLLKMTLAHTNDHNLLYLKYDGPIGCATSDSYATFLFDNDSTLTLKHVGKINCASDASVILLVDNEELLTQHKIVKIRVKRDSYADISIHKKFHTYVINGIPCLN